jgi:glycosyltransferase involved in cell wall biosynthesis
MKSTPPMRLLLVVPKLVSYRSFLRELCQSLVADGAEVHVACSPEPLWGEECEPAEKDVHLHRIEFARGMNPHDHVRAARALRALVRKIQPDLVHAHFSAAIFTTALGKTKRWPTTHATFHGVAFLAMEGWKRALLAAMETWAARRCDTAWVLTQDDCDGLRSAAGSATVRTLPGFGVGCDLERFTPITPEQRQALREEFGIAPRETVFAFVGRFVEFKGFALAVRAFLRLANPDTRLLLIGSRDRLHPTGLSAAEEAALAGSPHIVECGYRPDVERFLGAADAMVFPSRREGMPVCAMEALAMGIPVITFDSRGCREVVRHRVDGLVLKRQDTESLAAAMNLAVTDPDLRREWSMRAIADRDRLSRQLFVATQKSIYAEALSASQRPACAVVP